MHNFSTLMMGTVIDGFTFIYGNSLVAQIVKNLPAVQETQVQSLDRKSTRLNSSHYTRSRMPSSA